MSLRAFSSVLQTAAPLLSRRSPRIDYARVLGVSWLRYSSAERSLGAASRNLLCRRQAFGSSAASWSAVEAPETDSETPSTNKDGLILSDSCVEQIAVVTEGGEGVMLRVLVEGGGCSGFQYKFNLDAKVNLDDKVFERDGAKVVIDELSLSFLSGSTVDYHHELIRSSFRVVDNPNTELGCSCGASFALK